MTGSGVVVAPAALRRAGRLQRSAAARLDGVTGQQLGAAHRAGAESAVGDPDVAGALDGLIARLGRTLSGLAAATGGSASALDAAAAAYEAVERQICSQLVTVAGRRAQ